jgi:hypothetical protein
MDFERDSNTYAFFRLAATIGAGQDPVPERAILAEGYYLAIDIGSTRNFSSNKNFNKDFARTVGRERVDENGNSIISATGEWCQTIVDSRIARAERLQQLRFQRQREA